MKLYKCELRLGKIIKTDKIIFVLAKDEEDAVEQLDKKFSYNYVSMSLVENYIDNVKSNKINDDIPDKQTIDKVLNYLHRINNNDKAN